MIKPKVAKITTKFEIPAGMDHRWVFISPLLRSVVAPSAAKQVTVRSYVNEFATDYSEADMKTLLAKHELWIKQSLAELCGRCKNKGCNPGEA